MILNYHKDLKGLCIEFKSPTNDYRVSDAQKEMKKEYVKNGYAFILSNDYDKIRKAIHEYMKAREDKGDREGIRHTHPIP